ALEPVLPALGAAAGELLPVDRARAGARALVPGAGAARLQRPSAVHGPHERPASAACAGRRARCVRRRPPAWLGETGAGVRTRRSEGSRSSYRGGQGWWLLVTPHGPVHVLLPIPGGEQQPGVTAFV